MTGLLNVKEDRVIRSMFIYYDKDKDDMLNFDEFKSLCSDMGYALYDFQFIYINNKKNNKISYHEFKDWWIKDDKINVLLDENIDHVYCAHEMYKKNLVEFKELNYENFNDMTKTYYGYSTTKEEFKKYNKSGNGKLTFSEFLDWLEWI